MKFIHTADIHWGMTPDSDKPWTRERTQAIKDTFSQIVAKTRETEADFLFISGDLFHRQPLQKDLKEVKKLCTRSGGFVSHTGISDALELTKRAENGDQYAEMLWNTMIYQIEKCIGSMAAALHGKVDAILLGGGMVYSEDLVSQVKEACGWIAPVCAYPGEFEMEAMAAGAGRVLDGKEDVKKYTGVCNFQGFSF